MNGGLQLLSIEDTDSFTWLSEMNLKLPLPHSQNFQGGNNASMQVVFLDKEDEPAVDGEILKGDDNNPKNIVMMYEALWVEAVKNNEDENNHGKYMAKQR